MICERCGNSFSCELTPTNKKCWCEAYPSVTSLPTQYQNCLCVRCLEFFVAAKDGRAPQDPVPLVEGKDFYYDKGLYVFTQDYHLKRGRCCDSNCRHCPYKN